MADNNLDIARKQYADIKIGFDVNKSCKNITIHIYLII